MSLISEWQIDALLRGFRKHPFLGRVSLQRFEFSFAILLFDFCPLMF